MTAVTRGVVVASILLAMATGLWSLSTVPTLAGFLFAAFAGGVIGARWNFERAAMVVLVFAFISPGLTHLLAGPGHGLYSFAMLTAFVGVLVGGTTWTRWEAPGAWGTALAWWATGVALTWPLFAARDLGDPLIRSNAALPTVLAALLQMAPALWLDHLLGGRHRDEDAAAVRTPAARYFPAFIASAVLTAIAAAYQRVFDPLWLNSEPWIKYSRVPGLSGDSNPMAVATGVWAPVAVAFAAPTPAAKAVGAAAWRSASPASGGPRRARPRRSASAWDCWCSACFCWRRGFPARQSPASPAAGLCQRRRSAITLTSCCGGATGTAWRRWRRSRSTRGSASASAGFRASLRPTTGA
jgi:hypothetical protein